MTAWTAPITYVPGPPPLTAAQLNANLRDNTLYLKEHVDALEADLTDRVLVSNSGSLAVTDGAWTNLTFNTEVFDTNAMHDPGNPALLTCKRAGLYFVWGSAEFSASAVNERALGIWKGGVCYSRHNHPSGGVLALAVSLLIVLAVNDTVVLAAFKNSGPGDAVNVNATANFSPYFGMVRIPGT
jgi:hypothetical protein